MRGLLLAGVLVAASSAALAQDVYYYCTDAKAAGIKWDEKNPDGDGRVTDFLENRFTMKVISKMQRDITPTTGDTKGITAHYTCRTLISRPLLACIEKSIATELWLFKGNQFTRTRLFGLTLGGDPNITVAHGTCTKF